MTRTKPRSAPRAKRAVRCAIYTRKSTEDGLEQEFNSLDAQRDAGENYIRSQVHEGWEIIPGHYDDGGFTGGNMDRPALRRLMADIEAGRVDCVVVYKVDRLSRSLLDFARMMETFEKYKVSFVSVTQQFNTASSMGRLVLNVLLSFAQFEREIISERTRDKIAAARRKGKWVGGMPLLGFDVDPRGSKLIVNDDEAARVRAIFELYLEGDSVPAARDHRTRSHPPAATPADRPGPRLAEATEAVARPHRGISLSTEAGCSSSRFCPIITYRLTENPIGKLGKPAIRRIETGFRSASYTAEGSTTLPGLGPAADRHDRPSDGLGEICAPLLTRPANLREVHADSARPAAGLTGC
jgi:DNA invertase Pin-like site-specific DNA recombinase